MSLPHQLNIRNSLISSLQPGLLRSCSRQSPTHLHMYWIASWSPSQSLPLIVSYACHRQSSLDMLPSAALMPPWAATVWERVGNSLVRHLQGISIAVAARLAGVAW